MKVGNKFFIGNKQCRAIYQKFNEKASKAYCLNCRFAFLVDQNKLFETRECPQCNELLYKGWCKIK